MAGIDCRCMSIELSMHGEHVSPLTSLRSKKTVFPSGGVCMFQVLDIQLRKSDRLSAITPDRI